MICVLFKLNIYMSLVQKMALLFGVSTVYTEVSYIQKLNLLIEMLEFPLAVV